MVKGEPDRLSAHYEEYWTRYSKSAEAKKTVYDAVVASYNANPNPLDFLFISRTCYGGVLRYREADGYMSTPIGAHLAISPHKFNKRLCLWSQVVRETEFIAGDYSKITDLVTADSIIYCDPPYVDSQKILYGAQDFRLDRLINEIKKWKEKGAFVALSIDGSKFSGDKWIDLGISEDVFAEEIDIDLGGSMLKRFQLSKQNTSLHRVTDRLLLTSQISKS